MKKEQDSFDFFDDFFEQKMPAAPVSEELIEEDSLAVNKPLEPEKEPILPLAKKESEPVIVADDATPVVSAAKKEALTPLKMRQAVLQWLARQNPSGIAVKVPTRISKYQVDAAAFWSLPSGSRRRIEKTVLVEIRHSRDHCWPDCSNRETILKKICELKAEKTELERIIRSTEPKLKASDTLFEEFECWDYEKSRNPDYQRCLSKLEELQHSLYKGSRLELIRQSQTADYIYVAFPEGTIDADELIDGIGLLAIKDDLEIEEIKKPDTLVCSADNRRHIVQNIAIACKKAALFTNGVIFRQKGFLLLLLHAKGVNDVKIFAKNPLYNRISFCSVCLHAS